MDTDTLFKVRTLETRVGTATEYTCRDGVYRDIQRGDGLVLRTHEHNGVVKGSIHRRVTDDFGSHRLFEDITDVLRGEYDFDMPNGTRDYLLAFAKGGVRKEGDIQVAVNIQDGENSVHQRRVSRYSFKREDAIIMTTISTVAALIPVFAFEHYVGVSVENIDSFLITFFGSLASMLAGSHYGRVRYIERGYQSLNWLKRKIDKKKSRLDDREHRVNKADLKMGGRSYNSAAKRFQRARTSLFKFMDKIRDRRYFAGDAYLHEVRVDIEGRTMDEVYEFFERVSGDPELKKRGVERTQLAASQTQLAEARAELSEMQSLMRQIWMDKYGEPYERDAVSSRRLRAIN